MFVYLSKFLPQFVYPLGLVTIILFLSLFFLKHRKLAFWFILLSLVLLSVAGNRYFSAGLTRLVEWQYLPPAELPEADAMVVLGGGTESLDPPRQMAEVNGAGDRMLYADWLYDQGASPIILLSGGNLGFSSLRGTTPAYEMQQIMLQLGVPEEAMILQEDSQNTAEDALFSAEILRDLEIDEIILVTSALHMPRALALFEAQGLAVIPAPTDYTITTLAWSEMMDLELKDILLNLMPSSGALNQTTGVLKELLGTLVYRQQGWID